jgi:hypothetical protein
MKKILYFIFLFPTLLVAQCVDSLIGDPENLGIYGGRLTSLSLSRTSNRLFCGTDAPNNFFFSDDSANTWHKSFPFDSMSYECGTRGWAGELKEILTNNNGWVATRTIHKANFSSSQISFSNGDSGTFATAVDFSLLTQYGFNTITGSKTISDIDLTDHFMYIALERYLVKVNSNLFDPLNVFNVKDSLNVIQNDVNALQICATNNINGLPILALVDTTNNADNRFIIKYDGNSISHIQLPDTSLIYNQIYLPKFSTTTDTIFVISTNSDSTGNWIYRTFDNGVSWLNVSNNYYTILIPDFTYFKTEYSSVWKTYFPQSNGHILFSHYHFSVDLGNSWIQSDTPILPAVAMSYTDTGTIYITQISLKGIYMINSLYDTQNNTYQKNELLEAIEINGISQNKKVVYITTDMGIGYTSVYYDSIIKGDDKWMPPYGFFPIKIIACPQETKLIKQNH